MFPVQCKENLPVERVVITSIAVRGELGPITIWVSNDPDHESSTSTDAASAAVATAKRKRGSVKASKDILKLEMLKNFSKTLNF